VSQPKAPSRTKTPLAKARAESVAVILPGSLINGQPATLGVMGGGQLARMFVHAAQALGYQTAVLDPDAASPAGRVSHFHIKADYLNAQGLAELARHSHAITTEFENVPAAALLTLAKTRPVAPAASAVAIAQDRAAEKAHFVKCGVPCAPYALIESVAQRDAVGANLLPGILKTSRMGYDGKGQVRVKNRAELATAWAELKQVPCVLEKMLTLEAECSVIVARGRDGSCVNLPLQRNTHRGGILAVTEVFKKNMSEAVAKQAVLATNSIANELKYVGVLCVEFFIVRDSARAKPRLVVNEIAPRPHNSGHYSLNACDVSQFELQVRALAGLPLTQPRQHSPAIMLNLLGDLWPAAGSVAWDKLLALPGTHLHLYGKTEARAGRKMGHLNITGKTVEEVEATALKAARLLRIQPLAHWSLTAIDANSQAETRAKTKARR
jgi:5-(carboxyamino)imidazole ribonucleotide synthase